MGGWPRSRRPKNHTEGAPGPSLLGTGETPDLNWQEEAHGLAGSVPVTPQGPGAQSRPVGPAILLPAPQSRSPLVPQSLFFRRTRKRFLPAKHAKKTLSRVSIACLTALLGNSLRTIALIGSISRLHSPTKWPISRYLSQKIATSRANICGGAPHHLSEHLAP